MFRWTVGPALRVLFRIRVVNRPRLPGGFVLAANHASFLDPLLLGAACRQRITFLMTTVVRRSALLGWFYRWNRTIPVAPRGHNRDALRAARAVLERGEVLGIFPEGGISRDGQLMLGNPGAVALGRTGGVPVVPVAIVGAHRVLPAGARVPRLRRVTVVFGDPIAGAELDGLAGAGRRAQLAAATRRIMDEIARLGGQESREHWLERRAADAARA